MSKFYVSQPVRVNCPEMLPGHGPSVYHGMETFVTALHVPVQSHGIPLYVGTEVNLPTSAPGYTHCVFEDHELEPIVPPGLESNEEIDALYEPQPIEVRA